MKIDLSIRFIVDLYLLFIASDTFAYFLSEVRVLTQIYSGVTALIDALRIYEPDQEVGNLLSKANEG